MKKLKIIRLFLFTLLFLNGIYHNLNATDYPGEVDVNFINFNYDLNGYSHDALSIRAGYNTPIYQKEWEPAENTNIEFAYIKGQTYRKIRVEFYHNQNNNQNFTMVIGGGVYAGTGFGAIQYTSVYFPSGNEGKSNETILQFTGTVPSSVGKRQVKFIWDIVQLNGMSYCQNIGITGWHTYYTLLAAPKAPMTVPWTDVLDYACGWANGQSNSTNVAKKVTEGIYNMGDTDGDIDYDYYTYYCEDYDKLKLSYFLYRVKFTSNVQVNCTDCANLVNVFTAAVGCQSHNKRIWYGINTYEIDPIGSSYNWTTVSWSYHQYGWFNNKVNDASLRLDRYGTPRVPTNIDQGDYNDLLINGTLPSNFAIYTTEIVN